MKILNKIGAFLLLMGVASCQLTEIDEIDPQFVISAEDAFSKPEYAETALVGAYNKSLLNFGIWYYTVQHGGAMGVEVASAFSPNQYNRNDVTADNVIEGQYSEPYIAINTLNYGIEGISKLDESEFAGNRKSEMLGEIHFLRAQQYFNLLRFFGQFYDLNSKYGLVLHDAPNKSLNLKPRSTVQETYDFILADLDYAIQNAPEFSIATLASKQAAMAFKAQVLMYMGRYQEAVTYCDMVINSGDFELETNYADIFKETFNSKEAILTNYWDTEFNRQSGWKNFMYNFFVVVSDTYNNTIMPQDDPRRPSTVKVSFFGDNVIAKYPNSSAASFYMRLAEIYLIKAECIARSGGSLSDAQNALDIVRARVGLPSTAAPTKEALLEDIRNEKLLELAFEDGQSWFDLVRFDRMGELNISDYKATITRAEQLILPIPKNSVDLSEGLVEQNPGY